MKVNRSIPAATVVPVLVYPDVREAFAWLCPAFGFTERLRIGENPGEVNGSSRCASTTRALLRASENFRRPHLDGVAFSQTLADIAPEDWGGSTSIPADVRADIAQDAGLATRLLRAADGSAVRDHRDV